MRAAARAGYRRYSPQVTTAPRPNSTLYAAAAFVLSVFLFSLIGRPGSVLAGTPQPLTETARGKATLVAHSLSLSREHGYLVVSGEARNVSRRDLPQLEAVVELFDRNGCLVNVESGLVKLASIPAGDEAPFEVQAKDNSSVTTYRVRFRQIGGVAVASSTDPRTEL